MSILNILEKIVSYKKAEIKKRKVEIPIEQLEKQSGFLREVFSMKKFLRDSGKNRHHRRIQEKISFQRDH